MQSLAQHARKLEEIDQAEQDSADELARSLRTLGTLSDQVGGQFQGVEQSAGPLGERIESTSQRLDALNTMLSAATQGLGTALETLTRMASDTTEFKPQETIGGHWKRIALIRNEISPLTRTLNRQVKAVEQRAQAEEERTRRLVAVFDLLGGAAERISDKPSAAPGL